MVWTGCTGETDASVFPVSSLGQRRLMLLTLWPLAPLTTPSVPRGTLPLTRSRLASMPSLPSSHTFTGPPTGHTRGGLDMKFGNLEIIRSQTCHCGSHGPERALTAVSNPAPDRCSESYRKGTM